jgi:DNA-binding transcriptional LysR family regulator
MFLVVAEECSFTRAASKLGVSQSALSHAIRRLEANLGLRLLTRTTRSVSPTIAGERLVQTLRPAFADIDNKLMALTELRERPAGLIRLTTSLHAARTILWPAINRITAENPDIEIEINVDAGFVDIVAERYDAGVRLGESLEKDMIALPIGPRLRMAAVASPAYFSQRGRPTTPRDLAHHACINLRLPTSGGIYTWEFEQAEKELRVRVEGQLVLNDIDLIRKAALDNHGIAYVIEDHVAADIAEGALVRVLEDWTPPFDGYYLYYPSRRQPSPVFSMLLAALRFRE